ncbi:MAG: hypothetical protein FJ333_10105 [Sphingomonadales bacterium]|nr:hypothetical protein [Sphingomonadales bacterium]
MKEKNVSIVISDWEFGAGKLGSCEGPKCIVKSYQNQELPAHLMGEIVLVSADQIPHQQSDIQHQSGQQGNTRSNLKNGSALLKHQTAFAETVAGQLKLNHRCLLLTADHSNGIGGVSGLCRTVDANKVGVIWIDAHYDLHSPYTTPSGNSHGMAVNALIDDNNAEHAEQSVTPEEAQLWEAIKSIKGMGNAIPAKNLVFLGVRDFEKPEEALITKHGICSIQPQEIQDKGITACLDKALGHLSHCEHLYISFDVDSLDPSISQATGTPVSGGLSLDQAKTLIHALVNNPKCRCLEITEFNPSLPQPEEMLAAIQEILSVSGLF